MKVPKKARDAEVLRLLKAAGVSASDVRRLRWWARTAGKPLAAILQDAVWAYLLPIAADADAARK